MPYLSAYGTKSKKITTKMCEKLTSTGSPIRRVCRVPVDTP